MLTHQEVIVVIVLLDSSKKMVIVSTSTNALQKIKIKMIVAQIQIALILLQERVNFEIYINSVKIQTKKAAEIHVNIKILHPRHMRI